MAVTLPRSMLPAAAVVCLAACSAPGDTSSPTAPATWGPAVVAGRVVRTQDGTPIARASVRVGDASTQTDGDGRFQLLADRSDSVTVFAVGYLKRETWVPQADGDARDMTVDLIPSGDPFVLGFFRQFARNGFERRDDLFATRRWTSSPSFFIQTTLEDTGEDVPAEVIERVRTILIGSVPELSGGRLSVAQVTTGPTSGLRFPGTVNVQFFRDLEGTAIGRATVGGPSGFIHLQFDPANPVVLSGHPTGCDLRVYYVAEHEITHTVGFFHTFEELEDFHGVPGAGCVGAPRSDRARYHAAITYARPPGNGDIDSDPEPEVAALTGFAAGEGPVVFCDLRGVQ